MSTSQIGLRPLARPSMYQGPKQVSHVDTALSLDLDTTSKAIKRRTAAIKSQQNSSGNIKSQQNSSNGDGETTGMERMLRHAQSKEVVLGAGQGVKALQARKIEDKEASMKLAQFAKLTSNKTHAKMAKNKNGLATLKESLLSRPRFAKMVEYSVQCITNMAVDDLSTAEIIEEGIIETLARIAKLNPYNERIQRCLNDALTHFAGRSPALAAEVAKHFGSKALIHSMKKHQEPSTIMSTCRSVAALCKPAPETAATAAEFKKAGAVDAAVQILKNGANKKTDTHVAAQGEAVRVLQYLTANDAEGAKEMLQGNAMETVLETCSSEVHQKNPMVVLHTAGLVASITQADKAHQEKLKELGAVDILVEALDKHPTNKEVLQEGALALAHLTGKEDVAASMHGGGDGDAAKQMSKLASLLLVPENVQFMIRNKGVQWLLAEIQKGVLDLKTDSTSGKQDGKDDTVLVNGVRAIARLCTSVEVVDDMHKGKVLELLTEILTRHGRHGQVAVLIAQACFETLTELAWSKNHAELICKNQPLMNQVMAIAQHHLLDPTVTVAAVDFLNRVAAFQTTGSALAKAGTIQYVGRVMAHNNKEENYNPHVAQQCVKVLSTLLVGEQDNMMTCSRSGGMEALVGTLRLQKKDPNESLQTLRLCNVMANISQLAEELHGLGMTDIIMEIIDSNPNNPKILQLAQSTLKKFSGKEHASAGLAQLREVTKEIKATATVEENKRDEAQTPPLDKAKHYLQMISGLCLVDENKEKVISEKGVEILKDVFDAIRSDVSGEGPNAKLRAECLNEVVVILQALVGAGLKTGNVAHLLKMFEMDLKAMQEAENAVSRRKARDLRLVRKTQHLLENEDEKQKLKKKEKAHQRHNSSRGGVDISSAKDKLMVQLRAAPNRDEPEDEMADMDAVDQRLIENSLRMVAKMVKEGTKEDRKIMVENGTMKRLVTMAKLNPLNDVISRLASSTLVNLSVDFFVAVVQGGGVATVVDALKAGSQDMSSTKANMESLIRLLAIVGEGATKGYAQFIDVKDSDGRRGRTATIGDGARALGVSTGTNDRFRELQDRLLDANVLESLVSILETHAPQDRLLARDALSTLCTLMKGQPPDFMQSVVKDMADGVKKVFFAYIEEEDMMEEVMVLMDNMSKLNKIGSGPGMGGSQGLQASTAEIDLEDELFLFSEEEASLIKNCANKFKDNPRIFDGAFDLLSHMHHKEDLKAEDTLPVDGIEHKLMEQLKQKRAAEAERMAKLEAERKARAEEEKRQQEEAARKLAEEQARLEEERRRRLAEEEAARLEEERKRQEEERARQEALRLEEQRREEEDRRRREEEARRQREEEELRRQEEERLRKLEEEKLRLEQERLAAEEERRRREEEEERRRKEEEEKRKAEEEARRKAEEERLKALAQEEARKEAARIEAERQAREEEERKRREAEEERKRKEEVEARKRKEEEEARLKAEEEARLAEIARIEAERKKREEEARLRQEEELRKKQEEEAKRAAEAAERQAKLDQERKEWEEKEAQRKALEEKRFREEEAKRVALEREAKRQEELARKRKEEEERRLAEEEARRRREEEEWLRKTKERLEQEAALKASELESIVEEEVVESMETEETQTAAVKGVTIFGTPIGEAAKPIKQNLRHLVDKLANPEERKKFLDNVPTDVVEQLVPFYEGQECDEEMLGMFMDILEPLQESESVESEKLTKFSMDILKKSKEVKTRQRVAKVLAKVGGESLPNMCEEILELDDCDEEVMEILMEPLQEVLENSSTVSSHQAKVQQVMVSVIKKSQHAKTKSRAVFALSLQPMNEQVMKEAMVVDVHMALFNQMVLGHVEEAEGLKNMCDSAQMQPILSRDLGNEGSIDKLVKAMKENIDEPVFIGSALTLLHLLIRQDGSDEGDIINAVGKHKGMEVLVDIMKKYNSYEGDYEEIPQLMADLHLTTALCTLDHPDNCKKLLAHEGINPIVESMALQEENVDIAAGALSTLLQCGKVDPPTVQAFLMEEEGALRMIGDAIVNHDTRPDICLDSMQLIEILANYVPSPTQMMAKGEEAEAEGIRVLLKSGAGSAVVAGLSMHGIGDTPNRPILNTGIRLLALLTSLVKDEDDMLTLTYDGSVQAASAVLEQKSRALQMVALQCLINIAKFRATASLIVSTGAPEIMMKTMEDSQFNSEMSARCVKVYRHLSDADVEDKIALIDMGLIISLRDMMLHNLPTSGIQMDGLTTLAKMSFDPESATALEEAGMLDLIYQIYNRHSMVKALCPLVIEALQAMGRDHHNAALMADEAIRILKEIWRNHPKSGRSVLSGLVLAGVLTANDDVKAILPELDLIPYILDLCKSYGNKQKQLLNSGLMVMYNAALGSQACKKHLRKLGVQTFCEAETKKEKQPESVVKLAGAIVQLLTKQFVAEQFDAKIKKKHEDEEEIVGDLRNFLLSGSLVTKHHFHGNKKATQRHLYVDPSFKHIVMRRPHQDVRKRDMVRITSIRRAQSGRCTKVLQRKKLMKYICKDELSFSIECREREFSLEAESPEMRDEWVFALEKLILWSNGMKRMESDFNHR
eukprot:g65509.t1